jgi:hypothetical protein
MMQRGGDGKRVDDIAQRARLDEESCERRVDS